MILACAGLLFAQQPTTTRSGKRVPFRPGVLIDWSIPQVEVQARVVLQHGLLELFACTPNTREHESILQVQAPAEHIWQAIGLIGLEPGHPVQWDAESQRLIPATGDRVELRVRWPPEQPDRPMREADVCDWMLAMDTDRPPPPQAWIFAGSLRDQRGVLTAEYEGTVVAVVDFSTALIALPASHSDSNAELWLRANPDAVPPVGTECVLLIRPADDEAAIVRVDRLGRLRFGDQPVTRMELQARASELLKRRPAARMVIIPADRTPPKDVDEVRALLDKAGWPAERIEVRPAAAASQPASRPGALGELLRARLARHRELTETLERDHRQIGDRLTDRQRSAEQTADGVLRGLHRIGEELRTRLDAQQPSSRPVEPSTDNGTSNHQP